MRRVGLVGFGSIAEHGHLPAWQSFPQTEVAAVADLSPERLARARELLPDAVLYASPLDLIEQADVDTLDICTPPSTHADLIVRACERGVRDIISEKPFVLRVEEYERIARARARSGSRVAAINNWMHSDLFRHVREVLDSGVIGEVRSIELRTARPDAAKGHAGWLPQWRIDPAHAGGGIILDHGWHQIYLVLGWMGEPVRSVEARTATLNPCHAPVEDEATVDLLFARARARIILSWTASGRENAGCIEGTRGVIAVHDDRIEVQAPGFERVMPFAGRLTQSSYHPDWFEKTFYYNVVHSDRTEADRNFAEAGAIVGIVCAAYRSAHLRSKPRRPSSGAGVIPAQAGREQVHGYSASRGTSTE